MKVCLIGDTERNYLPYIEKYIRFFKKQGIEYDSICWQREESSVKAKKNEYNYYEKPKEGAFNKIISYARFKKYVIKILEKNRYDKIIVLSTVPCVALRKYILKNFKNKYIFDFRDYSFERFSPYKNIVDKLIDNSEFTTISSNGFMDFLDKNEKIIINHNVPDVSSVQTISDLKQKQVINIGFVGWVRYYEENIAFINKLKNEFRYQLWYIGKPIKNCGIQNYCCENEITNVSFIGKYDNKQKYDLYKSIDIINSIYGDDSLDATTALPHRLYEACIFKKPIISSKGTYLGEIIDQYGLGLVVNVDHDDVLSELNEYVRTFNQTTFLQGCENFLNDVKKDEEILYNKLKEFIIQ